MKHILHVSHYIFFSCICCLQALPAEYYVKPGGSDTNPGTNELVAWQTIQKAADTMVAGDTVYIMAGTYNEKVTPQNSGSPGMYITYTAYPCTTPVIDGQNALPASHWLGLFDISEKSYIRVSRLTAINSRNVGFFTYRSDHIIFEHLFTSNTWSSGIASWDNCSNVIISSNEVVKACMGDGGSGDLQECITVSGCHGFEVRYNHVHNRIFDRDTNGGEGIDAKDACSDGKIFNNVVHDLSELGIYVDAYNSTEENIEVFNNIVYNAYDGITLATEKNAGLLRNVRVYNNIVYNNTYDGIIIADNDQDGPKDTIIIINNTVYSNGYNTIGWGGGITVVSRNSNNDNLVIRNNIVSCNAEWQIMRIRPEGLVIDYNLIDGFRGYSGGNEVEVRGTDYVEAAPLLANPAGSDFHLLPGSPAIDAGTNADWTASDTDFDGNARIIGPACDMGAYEFVQNYTNPPSVPANCAASDGTTFGSVRVTWSAADRATYYQLFRSTTNAIAGAVNISGNTGLSPYIDATVSGTNRYFYWVRAGNNVGTSTFSNVDSGYALAGIAVNCTEWNLKQKRKSIFKGKGVSPILSSYLSGGYGMAIWDSSSQQAVTGLKQLSTKNNKVWKYRDPADKSIKIIYKEKVKKKTGEHITKLKYIYQGDIPESFIIYIAE
jgi:hypothetical protein